MERTFNRKLTGKAMLASKIVIRTSVFYFIIFYDPKEDGPSRILPGLTVSWAVFMRV